MEGANTKTEERILMIGATNRPQELDDVNFMNSLKVIDKVLFLGCVKEIPKEALYPSTKHGR